METKKKTLAECRQVYQTNSALGHRQLAYLIRLDKSKNGYNYLCIDKNCETDSYTLGELVSDLSEIYVEECNYDLTTSPIYKDFLFQKFISAELYAGQTKQSEIIAIHVGTNDIDQHGNQTITRGKQSEPVSLEVEEAAREYADKSFVWPKNKDDEDLTIPPAQIVPHGYRKHCKIAMKHFKAGAKWQSKQPASVAFLSDEEVQKKCFDLVDYNRQVAVFGKEKAENILQMSVLAMQHIQSELRKRVNVIDPVELMNWINKENYEKIHGDRWCKQFMSQTHSSEELLKIYLTSK